MVTLSCPLRARCPATTTRRPAPTVAAAFATAFAVTFAIAVIAVIAVGARAATETDEPGPRWNVLLITVDCLRPDHMSLYGYERDTTPYLSRFAEESLVFENAFSTSAWTGPGVASLLTGYYPPVHGQGGQFSYYDEKMPSPLRIFRKAGYRVLGDTVDGPTFGNMGFHGRLYPRPYFELFVEQQIQTEQPFFAWVHLRETHLPYNPSERNANRWFDPSQTSEGVEAVRGHYLILRPEDIEVRYRNAGKVTFTDGDVAAIRGLYDGTVLDVDQRLEQVFERMRESGLLDETLVIISADHGEELLEHGWVGHASTSYDGKLYDELIRIPLIIRLPDAGKTGRFDTLVQGVDVMPTIFELLELDPEPLKPAMQGHSLMPVVDGQSDSVRDYVFNDTTVKGWTTPRAEVPRRVRSVRSRTHKLIWFPDGDGLRIEGYDLREDPGEQHNIFPARATEFAPLEAAYGAWVDENRRWAADLVLPAAEQHTAELAAALGEADLLAAVRAWDGLELLNQTWGLEAEPFYADGPQAAAWEAMRRAAAEQIGDAMGCRAGGGALEPVPAPADQADTAGTWRCGQN